jgi:N-acetylglucosaminyldiphosphoundecaprenol N-acetyl-beta-D-mannosaminyltransferase
MNMMATKMNPDHISILGVRVDKLPLADLLLRTAQIIRENNKVIISNVNVHAANIAYRNDSFRSFINQSQFVFCDGFGVKLAARLIAENLPERYTPPDFIDQIAELAANSGWRVFFLGAKPGVAQLAAKKLMAKYPRLQISTQHGYFEKSRSSPENASIVEKINDFQPHILVVGFGMPLQEKWIEDNFAALQANIFFPAGALFDYVAGNIVRAPRCMTDNGFEWLGRLLIEPKRLWQRYIIGNPLFFWRVFIHHILKIPLPKK